MNTLNTSSEKQLIKAIKSGKYKNQFLVYNRKSTDEALSQKNSISYQKAENTRFSDRENLPIALVSIKGFCTNGIVSEKHSGFKEDDFLSFNSQGMVQYKIERPKFQKLLQFLNQGYFKGIICLCWDRISRNKADDTILHKLLRRGVDIRFVFASYDKSSAGALHMDIDGMFSQHHSRVTSEKVTLANKNNRDKGIWTHRAPLGYLNQGQMNHKPIDPIRGPIIKELFKLYATGTWSLGDLMGFAHEQGLTTMPMRRPRTKEELLDEDFEITDIPKVSRPITKNQISRIFKNRFYTGYFSDSNNQLIKSNSHEPLVDETLFNQVSQLLKTKCVSVQYTNKLSLPLRGRIRCSLCLRVYTPYQKKGILYYNARCQKDCQNTFKNFNFDYIAKGIGEKIKRLCFTEDELIKLDLRTGTDLAILEEKRVSDIEKNDRKKKKIREDLSYLRIHKLNLLTSGAYTPEDYFTQEQSLQDKLVALTDKEQVSDIAMHDMVKEVQKFSELLKTLSTHYDFANNSEKEQIIQILFSELFVANDTLKYKAHIGLECLESRFEAVGDLSAWFSELSRQSPYIKSSIEKLDAFLNQIDMAR